MQNTLMKKIIWAAVAILMLAAVSFGAYKWLERTGSLPAVVRPVIVVEEKLVIPETTKVVQNAGRVAEQGVVEAPINPDRGEVVSARAILTLKGGYDAALVEALVWAPDAALVFEKSLGVVTAEGKSGEWQVTFGSKAKKAGFEVLVYGDAIAAKKEIPSASYGFALPQNWYDSEDALLSLRTMPQFEAATVSSISFYYNEDGKRWGYALATSNGTVSMPVK